MAGKFGIAGKIAHAFIDSKLTPLIIGASILLGIGAILLLPREEEPQIIAQTIQEGANLAEEPPADPWRRVQRAVDLR